MRNYRFKYIPLGLPLEKAEPPNIGYDLRVYGLKKPLFYTGLETRIIRTGIRLKLCDGIYMLVIPRLNIEEKGFSILAPLPNNSFTGPDGEIHVKLFSREAKPLILQNNDKFAQLIIYCEANVTLIESSSFGM